MGELPGHPIAGIAWIAFLPTPSCQTHPVQPGGGPPAGMPPAPDRPASKPPLLVLDDDAVDVWSADVPVTTVSPAVRPLVTCARSEVNEADLDAAGLDGRRRCQGRGRVGARWSRSRAMAGPRPRPRLRDDDRDVGRHPGQGPSRVVVDGPWGGGGRGGRALRRRCRARRRPSAVSSSVDRDVVGHDARAAGRRRRPG